MEMTCELILLNLILVSFLGVSGLQAYRHKNTMTETALHHLLSHWYIVFFLTLSLNAYLLKGFVVPLIFVMLHFLQHITKENIRLTKTDKWTEGLS